MKRSRKSKYVAEVKRWIRDTHWRSAVYGKDPTAVMEMHRHLYTDVPCLDKMNQMIQCKWQLLSQNAYDMIMRSVIRISTI